MQKPQFEEEMRVWNLIYYKIKECPVPYRQAVQ